VDAIVSWFAYALNRAIHWFRTSSGPTGCLVKGVIIYVVLNLLLCVCSAPFVILSRVFPSTPTPTPVLGAADRRHTASAFPTLTPWPTETHTPRPTDTPTATPLPTPAPGQRFAPVPLGSTFLWRGDGREVELTVAQVLFGDEALGVVQKANQYNEPPPEGFAYVLVYAKARYVTGSEAVPWGMDEFDFVTVSKNRIWRAPSVVDPQPNFAWQGFPGAVGEGWMTFLAYADDPAPALVFVPDSGGDVSQGVWFALK